MTARKRTGKRALLDYSPALVVVVIAIADMGRFADPDLWRHIIVGRSIMMSRQITFGDPYSYSVAGHFWRNHSWLAEVISALFYDAAGVIGLNVMKLACTATLVLLMAMGIGETGAATLLQFIVLLVSGALLEPFLQFRPQLYTYLLFSAVMFLLVRHNFRGVAQLWIAIPLMALWANLHGGFVVGIGTIGLYSAASAVQDLAKGRGWGRAMRLGAVTVACAAATLATPYGISSWYTVAHSATSVEARGAINEWRPLLVAMAMQWDESHRTAVFYGLAVGLMASLGLCVALAPRGEDFPLVAVAVLTIVGAFMALRNVPLAIIAIAVPLTFHAGVVLERFGWGASEAEDERASAANQVVLSGLAALILVGGGFFAKRLRTTIAYPGGAIAFMDSHSLRGNILDDINWGDYLLWHAPGSKIFIDGRFETLYPAEFIRKYLVFHVGNPAGSQLLDEYPHDFVLMPPDSGGARLMRSRSDWKLIYQDENAVLFARAESAAARIPGIPVSGKAPPSYFP